MDEAVRSMEENSTLVSETTGSELYGPFGCPALGISANDVISVEINLKKREEHGAPSCDPIKKAEARKARVTTLLF